MKEKIQTLDVMLGLALQNLLNMVEFCDVNGYGQKSDTLKEAREFGDELLLFVRYRQCCANCYHYRQLYGRKHSVCCNVKEAPWEIQDDPGVYGRKCKHYVCKYEDIRKPRKRTKNGTKANKGPHS